MNFIKPGRILPCLLLGLLTALPAHAEDLLSVYRQALDSDPTFLSARASHSAALEARPQSRAGVLPSIALSGSVARDRYDVHSSGQPATTSTATNKTYDLSLRQPIFRLDRFLQLKQADSRIAQADATFAAAQQALILRVATTYFQVLGARDNLEFVRADKAALKSTLEQAQQRFEVGLSAITDKLKAQAAYDVSVSDEIAAEQQLSDANEAMRELTGALPATLSILQPDVPLLSPQPDDLEHWVKAALEQNPQMLAATAAADTAREEVRIQRAGHYPTLDLTADYGYVNSLFGGNFQQKYNDTSIGLQLNLPLYSGGLTSSRTRQQADLYSQALQQQVQQHRAVERQTRDNYRGVVSGISRVQALSRAIESNAKALEAAKSGFDVGTRDIIDVLDAQRGLLGARRDYARSRYDYLLATLQLKQDAGILAESDLAQINAWLVAGEQQ
jgi:outer membrane protein